MPGLLEIPDRIRLFICFGCLWGFGLVPAAAQQPFACDGAFYLATIKSTAGTQMQRIMPDGGAYRVEDFPLSDPGRRLTCLGFSVRTMYIYALDFDSHELLRIDARGQVVSLGVPANLPANLEYWAGDVSADGRNLTVVGHDPKTGRDERIYSIGLRGSTYGAGYISITTGINVRLTDLATDPVQGVQYGYDAKAKKLVTVANGEVSSYALASVPEFAGALFFGREGTLYGYGNASAEFSDNALFRFDKRTGRATLLKNGISGKYSDGCSCPYTMDFLRQVTPEEVLPCGEITVTYEIDNNSGTSWLGMHLIDEFPEGFTITAIEEQTSTLSTVVRGAGDRALELRNMDIKLGSNRVRLRVRVGEEVRGRFDTQATLSNLPDGLGTTLFSDNRTTAPRGDPNPLRVAPPEALDIAIDLTYSCDGDSATLTLPLAADRYRWSNGATTPSTTVRAGGMYAVEADNGCFVFTDTLVLDRPPEALRVDLGPDRRVRLGDRVDLAFSSNGRPTAWQWSATDTAGLSCTECEQPTLLATREAGIVLAITDERGCQASDSLRIFVEAVRRVYLPNAFSPDGDGVNDVFIIQGRGGAEVVSLQVFNRWGVLVFDSPGGLVGDVAHGWDGTVRGRPAETGVYLFAALVRFADGREERFAGDLVLIRKI